MNIENLTYKEKCNLAKNSNNLNVLTKLSEDEDWLVRDMVAGNPNTPVKVLKRLAKDVDVDVRETVLGNKNCPEILKLIYG